jgi:hypothetical protein
VITYRAARCWIATAAVALAPAVAAAADGDEGAREPARAETGGESEAPEPTGPDDPEPEETSFRASGYVETFYQWNFNRPSNGLSNLRGYDNRHDSITISNAVLDTGFRAHTLEARFALQWGHTPAAYYADEPALAGSEGANATGPLLWRHLQRAAVGWNATEALLFEAGLFLSPMGLDAIAVKDNWNWSRTNASTALPDYHVGLRTTWHATDELDIVAGLVNGWNRIVDDNAHKSLFLQAVLKKEKRLSATLTYFGGVERETGAPEGSPLRHAFDAFAQLDVTRWLSAALDATGGWENGRFGVHPWAGAASYLRVQPLSWLYLAPRIDSLWEGAPDGAESILVPARRVSSFTATADARPAKGVSVRLEYRRDHASTDLYFRGEVEGEGSEEQPFVPNASRQDSVLLGVVGWL